MTELVIIVLGALLVSQHIFWILQTHRLINKVMSRNFPEYVQTKVLEKTATQDKTQIRVESEPVEDFGRLM